MIEKIKKWRYTANNNTVILFCESGLVTYVISNKHQKKIKKKFEGWNIYSVIRYLLETYKSINISRLKKGNWVKLNKNKLNKIVKIK